jgi:hypothetical protein
MSWLIDFKRWQASGRQWADAEQCPLGAARIGKKARAYRRHYVLDDVAEVIVLEPPTYELSVTGASVPIIVNGLSDEPPVLPIDA